MMMITNDTTLMLNTDRLKKNSLYIKSSFSTYSLSLFRRIVMQPAIFIMILFKVG